MEASLGWHLLLPSGSSLLETLDQELNTTASLTSFLQQDTSGDPAGKPAALP